MTTGKMEIFGDYYTEEGEEADETKTVFPCDTIELKLSMAEKMKLAEPYNLFLATIPSMKETWDEPGSITFRELLCPSLGTLANSLHLGFQFDINWLLKQYDLRGLRELPMTLLYGLRYANHSRLEKFMNAVCPQITHVFVEPPWSKGLHHSKMSIYSYDDGSLRVVVATVDLFSNDWTELAQQIWVSPLCPPLGSTTGASGESPTRFKSSLISYLKTYRFTCLNTWIDKIKDADFSAVKVFLIASIPGKHFPRQLSCHLHTVGEILSQHCELPRTGRWPIVAQTHTMGNYNKAWIQTAFLRAFASHKNSQLPRNSQEKLCLIYHTFKNTQNTLNATNHNCFYTKERHDEQKWLQDEGYLYTWKADRFNRTGLMPSHRFVSRVSPDSKELAWYLLTSANISKNAMGGYLWKDGSIMTRSYELGVLFLPQFFCETSFDIKKFPILSDFPLTPYNRLDEPFTVKELRQDYGDFNRNCK